MSNKITFKAKMESRNAIKNNKDSEYRLEYVMNMLGLNELIQMFHSSNITFDELIRMTKREIMLYNLELYQRNRLNNFIMSINKENVGDSIESLIYFFHSHRQFIFSKNIQLVNYEKGCVLTAKFCNEENNNGNGNSKRNNIAINNNNVAQKDGDDCNDNDNDNDYEDDDDTNNDKGNNCNHNYFNKKSIRKTEDVSLKNNTPHKIIYNLNKHNQSNYPTKFTNINLSNSHPYNNYITNTTTKAKYYNRKKSKSVLNSSSYIYCDSIYQSYVNINKDSDMILEKLKKSKEERKTKHAHYNSLISKNGMKTSTTHHSQHYSQSNYDNYSNLYNDNDNNRRDDGLNSNSNTRQTEIDFLTTILNKKKRLQHDLSKCNKSIFDNKKLLIQLSNEIETIDYSNSQRYNKVNANECISVDPEKDKFKQGRVNKKELCDIEEIQGFTDNSARERENGEEYNDYDYHKGKQYKKHNNDKCNN